jgi:transcription initiation factor TFIIIB Brf1 subunit/transcription initiation factor TFIIB
VGLLNCPSCKNKVSDKATACPKCGHPIKENIKEIKEKNFVDNLCGCLGLIALIVILLFWLAFSEDESRENFESTKPEIIAELNKLLNDQKYEQVIEKTKELKKFNDEEIEEIIKKAEALNLKSLENKLFEKVKKIPASKIVENMNGYSDLLKMDPDNDLYKRKYNHYKNLVENRRKNIKSKNKEIACNNVMSAIDYGVLKDTYDKSAFVDITKWSSQNYEQKVVLLRSLSVCFGVQLVELKSNTTGQVVGEWVVNKAKVYQ